MKLFRIAFYFFLGMSTSVLSAAESMTDEELQQAMMSIQKIQILDRPCVLVGMGLTQLMNDDYYIGAFYMDEIADRAAADDLIELHAARRMEFKFVSDRKIPASSFKRQLIQAVKINNKKEDLDAQNENLKKFFKLFNGSYKKGDTLTLDFHPTFGSAYSRNGGTRLSVNGKLIGEVAGGGDMYSLLVRSWVGERPPTSVFKKSILGRSETSYLIALQKRYASLQ